MRETRSGTDKPDPEAGAWTTSRRRRLRRWQRAPTRRPLVALSPDGAGIDVLGPQLLAGLGLVPPMTAAEFLRAYARRRWLRITIHPFDGRDSTLTAFVMRRSRRRYAVFRDPHADIQKREWATWHEAGHIAFAHLRIGGTTGDTAQRNAAEERAAELFAEVMWVYARGDGPGPLVLHVDRDVRAFLGDMGVW